MFNCYWLDTPIKASKQKGRQGFAGIAQESDNTGPRYYTTTADTKGHSLQTDAIASDTDHRRPCSGNKMVGGKSKATPVLREISHRDEKTEKYSCL